MALSVCCESADADLWTSWQRSTSFREAVSKVVNESSKQASAWDCRTSESTTASPLSRSRFGSEARTLATRVELRATGLRCRCRLLSSGNCRHGERKRASYQQTGGCLATRMPLTFDASAGKSIEAIAFACRASSARVSTRCRAPRQLSVARTPLRTATESSSTAGQRGRWSAPAAQQSVNRFNVAIRECLRLQTLQTRTDRRELVV